MDYDFPAPGVYRFDVDAYFKAYSPHRSDQFLLGVEIGLQRFVAEKNHKFVKTWPFDMVIGSVHAVCGKDLYELSYFQSFPEKKSAYETYLRDVYENIRDFDDFDTLGHIDYICRKSPYSDQLLHYEEFSEMIDKILMLLSEKKKSLEINTRLFDQKEAVKELEIICRRFTKLGGQMVTIGSDAHKASAVGSRIENAYELARKCGLIPVVYKARQPYPVK